MTCASRVPRRLRLCWFRLIPLLITTVTTVPTTAWGQAGGTIQIEGFAAWSPYSRDLPLADAIGGGGGIGVYLARGLSLSADVMISETTDTTGAIITHMPARVWLQYGVRPFRWLGIYAGPGFVHSEYRRELRGADNGVAGTAGIRIRLSPAYAVRFSALGDHIPDPAIDPTTNRTIRWSFRAGMAFFLRFSRSY